MTSEMTLLPFVHTLGSLVPFTDKCGWATHEPLALCFQPDSNHHANELGIGPDSCYVRLSGSL
jgi:hypothetical protein